MALHLLSSKNEVCNADDGILIANTPPVSSLLLDAKKLTKQLVRYNLLALKNTEFDIENDESSQKMIEILINRFEGASKSSCISNHKKLNKANIEANQNEKCGLLHYIISISHVSPVVQNGPSCGLAALSMALQILTPEKKNNGMEIDSIIQIAKSLGFTKQGEMFSIKSLLELAQHINENIEGKITESTTDVQEKKKLILQALFNHHPILVPYDRDFNNEPCMKDGVKAHWALVIGFLIVKTEFEEDLMQLLKPSYEVSHIFYLMNNEDLSKEDSFIRFQTDIIQGGNKESKELYIFAVQGKSLKPHIWDLDELLESNNQLRTVDPAMLRCRDEFRLPCDGSLSSLQGKILILNNK